MEARTIAGNGGVMHEGITAVGLMTLRQTGPETFADAPGKVHLSERARAISAHQLLARRAKDDWQGPLGFLRGVRRRWTVTFDESEPAATFPLIHGQEIASAAQSDKRDYRSRDPRCIPGEGPIPVECRAASRMYCIRESPTSAGGSGDGPSSTMISSHDG